jgi:hypothetical protein
MLIENVIIVEIQTTEYWYAQRNKKGKPAYWYAMQPTNRAYWYAEEVHIDVTTMAYWYALSTY